MERALQYSVLKTWQGKEENIVKAQEMLLKRAKLNGLATEGKYETEDIKGESLHLSNYTY